MATDFNPQLQDTGVPNMTGRSQGTGPNRTFESIFSGLNQTFNNVTSIQDTNTQKAIYDEATQAFDNVNADFGLTPETSGQLGASPTSPTNVEGVPVTPPASMQSELSRIQILQNAKDQGKITEMNYYGRLATLSKQLRAKYPRYDEVIDKTIQSVTGTRPANAYREAIFSALGSVAQEASDEEKFKRQYFKQNEAELFQIYGDDFFKNPGNYDFNQVSADVARFKARKDSVTSQIQDLTLQSKTGEVNAKTAEKTMSQDFSFIVESELNKALGQNRPSFNQTLNTFINSNQTPGDLDNFIVSLTTAETNLRNALLQKAARDYNGIMSQDEVNKQVDAAMYPLNQAKDAVLGKDFKLASRYATLSKAIQDQQLSGMLQASPELMVGSGLSQISQAAGQDYLNSKGIDQLANIGLEVAGRVMSGEQPGVIKGVVESGNSRASRSVIDQSFSVLTDSKATGSNVSNIVKEMFGPAAVDWMSPKVVNRDDIEGLYLKFLDPKVTKAIKEKGTPEDLQTYTSWAMEKFTQIPAFRSAAGNVDGTLPTGTQVIYDAENKRLVLTGSPEYRMVSSNNAKRAVDSMNRAFSVLRPIIEANGQNGDLIIPQLVKDLSVQLDPDEKGILTKIYDALTAPTPRGAYEGQPGALGSIGDLGSMLNPISAANAAIPPSDFDGQIDFEDEDYDPLDEESFAQTPTPRPRGGGLADLVTSNKRGYTPDVENLNQSMKTGLSELQTAWGRDLPIISGYRDAARNRRAGGAKRSQHIHGNAVDIDVSDLSTDERKQLISKARELGFTGIGVYPNSLHLDKGGRRAWGPNYSRTSLPRWAREVLG